MQTLPSYDELLTVREVAEKLRLHENTVRRMVRDGELAAHRRKGTSTRIRITAQSVNEYLHSTAVR